MSPLTRLLPLLAVVAVSGCNTPTTQAPPLSQQAVENRIPDKPAGLYDPNELSSQPIPVSQRRPVYPFELRRRGISGEAVVVFVVRTDGSVSDAAIVKASDIRFGQAAVDCVSQWRFRPGIKDGTPVNCRMMVPIYFTLNE